MEIIYTKGYEALKDELKQELSKSVESFIRIGYLLKVARDTDVLEKSPYNNMEEFAYAEFKIDKGTASKFMGINDRFSEGGYSDRIKTEYSGIGWSKLSIMLQLPDTVNEEITPAFSKSDIQALREEVAEAERQTPLETVLEGESNTTSVGEELIDKVVRQLGESDPEIYTAVHKLVKGQDYTYDLDEIKAVMAPSGENIYSIRIRGVGRIMLSVKDHEETISMVNERTGEKEVKLWSDLVLAWIQIIDVDQKPEENWETVYGQRYPKKEEVAPVQPKQNAGKVRKVNEKPENNTVEKSGEPAKVQGASGIVMGDQQEPEEEGSGTDGRVVITSEQYDMRKRSYISGYNDCIVKARYYDADGQWEDVKKYLENAERYVDMLIELESMEVEEENHHGGKI